MSSASFRGRAGYWGRAFARFVLAVVLVIYAAAKFTGAQFVVPGFVLDTPVADLSGMDLTWAFFAHSPLYSGFVAVGQLVAAALLAFDRTARLGAVVLLPITANVALVNFGYNIGAATLAISLVLLALNLGLLAGEFRALKRCFWDDTASDPTRPPLLGHPAAGVARGAAFALIVGGIFWLFAGIMGGPAGGQKALDGDWLVESATVDGRPAADHAVGADWLWVCFDPYGRLSVRTKRHTFRGKYTVDPATGGFSARYDPEPLPPFYPGPTDRFKLTDAEKIRVMGEQYAAFKWPVELAGGYRKDGPKLVVTTQRGGERVEWVLAPYERPKF